MSKRIFTALALSLTPLASHAEVQVITDIAPVTAAVSMITEGVFTPHSMAKRGGSAHSSQFSPSQIQKLQNAQGVIMIGEGILPQMGKLLDQNHPKKPVLRLMSLIDDAHDHSSHDDHDDHEGHKDHDDHESHDDHDDHDEHTGHDEHDHHGKDPHIWLDPVVVRSWMDPIASFLTQLDPENGAKYAANSAKAQEELSNLTNEIEHMHLEDHAKRFAVTHDAYGYFQARFGLGDPIRLGDGHGHGVGAQTLGLLHEALENGEIACLIVDPSHNSPAALDFAKRENIPLFTAHPLYAGQEEAPNYPALIRTIAAQFEKCFQ